MKQNPTRSQPAEKKKLQTREEMYCWDPEKMLDALLKNQEKVEEKWPETGLPKLVDDVIRSYETIGGMDHLEGRDLPSKKVVTEVLEDTGLLLLNPQHPGWEEPAEFQCIALGLGEGHALVEGGVLQQLDAGGHRSGNGHGDDSG